MAQPIRAELSLCFRCLIERECRSLCIFSEGKNMSVSVIYYIVTSTKLSFYKYVKWIHLIYHPVSEERNLLFNLVCMLWLHKTV